MTILKDTEQIVNYYQKEQKVYEYGIEFWKKIIQCSVSNIILRDDILPIQCYLSYDDIIEAAQMGLSTSAVSFARIMYSEKCQAVIRIGINGENNRLTSDLKQTIRHETIHYFLWLSGLPCEDSSLEFWCYCYVFDGAAYETLSDEDKVMYDRFVTLYDSELKELPEVIKSLMTALAISKLRETNNDDEYTRVMKEEISKIKSVFSQYF